MKQAVAKLNARGYAIMGDVAMAIKNMQPVKAIVVLVEDVALPQKQYVKLHATSFIVHHRALLLLHPLHHRLQILRLPR
tara:strand:- start:435 stop:671 length:237 start_codon:yes stop_codon:yes gene_type:complete